MKKQWISLLALASFLITGCQKGTSTVASVVSDSPVSAVASTSPSASPSVSTSPSVTSTVKIPATGITLDQTTLSIRPDETVTLKATVAPSNTTDWIVRWSSSADDIASVDYAGVVTALKPGTATITAKAGDQTATCAVTVLESYPTGVNVDILSGSLGIGETHALTASVAPATAAQAVTFVSDDPTIATVSDAGVVTAVAIGTAHITVTAGAKDKDGNDVSAKVTFIVNYSNVTSFTATADKTELYPDETAQITATITPEKANHAVAFVSSDETIVTVSSTGLVTPVAPGTATVTASSVEDSSQNQTFDFVVSSYVTDLTVDAAITMDVGTTHQITAAVSPSTASQEVTYATADATIATVSDEGLISALLPGSSTTITVTTVGVTATEKKTVAKTITVTTSGYANATGVTVSGYTSVNIGSTATLTATVAPSSANPSVTWSSSDETIATVSTAGVVTGVAIGKATITATSVGLDKNGATVSGTYDVNVDLAAGNVTATAAKTALTVGETTQITSHVYLADNTTLARMQDVSYSVINMGPGKYLSVSSTGLVTALAAGSGMIIVKSIQAPRTAGINITFSITAA